MKRHLFWLACLVLCSTGCGFTGEPDPGGLAASEGLNRFGSFISAFDGADSACLRHYRSSR